MKKTLLLIFKILILLLALFVLGCSAFKLYEYNRYKAENEKLAKGYVTESDNKLKAPISVNFDKMENEDVVGWLYCENTPINNPIVIAEDNDYYLHRQLDGKYNFAGTLFVDYRNKADFSDFNTVIYGHNMKNDTMLGILPEFRKEDFLKEHSEMYLLTPSMNYKIKIVACKTIDSRNEIYNVSVENKYSVYDLIGREYSVFDRFLTLSTCSYSNNDTRIILIGIICDAEETDLAND